MSRHSGRDNLIRHQRLACIHDVHFGLAIEPHRDGAAQCDPLLTHPADRGIGHVEINGEQIRLDHREVHHPTRCVLCLEPAAGEQPVGDFATQHCEIKRTAFELEHSREIFLDDAHFDDTNLRQRLALHAFFQRGVRRS